VYASTTQSPILLVGTAHVVDLAEPLQRTLSGRALQGIAIELDQERLQHLLSEGALGPGRSGGPFFLRLWAAIQRRLGEELGTGAGAEMRAAATLAKDWKLPLFLIDDPIRETLAQLLRSLSVQERLRLIFGSVAGLFIPSRMIRRQIGEYSKHPGELLEEMRTQFPGVTRVLLDARNEHMAERLARIRLQGCGRLAAVVGDAHLPGLASALRRRGVPVETVAFAQLLAIGPSTGSVPPG
jgi:pheromone shutdown protein TraB